MCSLWREGGRVGLIMTISEKQKKKKAVENMERADGWKSSISSSGSLKSTPCGDILASLGIRLPPTVKIQKKKGKTLPRYIFFSPSLFTEAVVCDRSSGRSQVPRKLTAFLLSTANECSRLPLHTDAHGPVDASARRVTFQTLRLKWRKRLLFHEQRWLPTQFEAGSARQGQTPTALICSQTAKRHFSTQVCTMFYGLWECSDSILEPLLPAQHTGNTKKMLEDPLFVPVIGTKNIFNISCFDKDVQIQQIWQQDKQI